MSGSSGSMRERSPGRWQLRVFTGRDPLSGKPQYATKTVVGGKREANRQLAKMITDAAEGKFDATTATVGQLLDKWLEAITPNRRPKTIAGYRTWIENRIRPALGKIRLDRLRPDVMDEWYGRWLNDGLSPTSVHHMHAILSAALTQALKWGWISSSPASRCSPPPLRSKPVEVPTPGELDGLYEAAKDTDGVLAAAIALAGLTGARRGELCALRWSDVDLTVGAVRIARSLTNTSGAVHIGPTKTHQERVVGLDDRGVKILRARWEAQREFAEKAGTTLAEDPYVLSYNANSAEPVSPDTLTHRFSALCRRHGLSYRFHDLRHFSATTLIAAGVDPRTVTARHGWADMAMLNRYAHMLPERDRAAAAVLGAAFGR